MPYPSVDDESQFPWVSWYNPLSSPHESVPVTSEPLQFLSSALIAGGDLILAAPDPLPVVDEVLAYSMVGIGQYIQMPISSYYIADEWIESNILNP